MTQNYIFADMKVYVENPVASTHESTKLKSELLGTRPAASRHQQQGTGVRNSGTAPLLTAPEAERRGSAHSEPGPHGQARTQARAETRLPHGRGLCAVKLAGPTWSQSKLQPSLKRLRRCGGPGSATHPEEEA